MSEASVSFERRNSPSRVTVDLDENRLLRGHAIVFNSLSHVMRDRRFGVFRERIKPEAVDRTLRSGEPVKALWNHNSDLVLGNTKAGTLTLKKTSKWLAIEVDPPKWANPQVETVARGDVDGMSFEFSVIEDTWDDEDEEGVPIRDVTDMVFPEISFVTFPAYPETDVQVAKRSLDEFFRTRARTHHTQWRAQMHEIRKIAAGR